MEGLQILFGMARRPCRETGSASFIFTVGYRLILGIILQRLKITNVIFVWSEAPLLFGEAVASQKIKKARENPEPFLFIT